MTDRSRSQTSTPATAAIFVLLRPRSGVTRDQIMAVMPPEIRATVQLYLEGKIREWYSREDGRGAVFLLNATNITEARSVMEALPLAREHLIDEEYIPVSPLAPLRLLVANPSADQLSRMN